MEQRKEARLTDGYFRRKMCYELNIYPAVRPTARFLDSE